MPRLIRPPISTETKCRVALQQLGEMFIDTVVAKHRNDRSLGNLLFAKLDRLADLLGCTKKDLRLDHDPALGTRQKVFDKAGNHVDYIPAASDPRHLIYRSHAKHLIKTNVRGEHGQHPDRVLIKKNRRLEKREAEPKRRKSAFLIEKPHRRPKKRARIQGRSNWATGRKLQGRSSWR